MLLTKELEAYDGEKALLRQAKARLLVAENRLNSLKWEDEVLRQKHLEVVAQRDELKEKHRELIAEVKQKASFKHLLLEKKFDAVAEQLEARDAQLDDALSRANVDVSRLSKEAAAQRARAKGYYWEEGCGTGLDQRRNFQDRGGPPGPDGRGRPEDDGLGRADRGTRVGRAPWSRGTDSRHAVEHASMAWRTTCDSARKRRKILISTVPSELGARLGLRDLACRPNRVGRWSKTNCQCRQGVASCPRTPRLLYKSRCRRRCKGLRLVSWFRPSMARVSLTVQRHPLRLAAC